MDTKTYKAGMDLPGDRGRFEAIFSRFNVIDHDGDVTRATAFTPGAPVVIEGWAHDQGLPVGKGVIRVEPNVAKVEGSFFLNTQTGREHYAVVKAMGPAQEWSYTFNIVKSERGTFQGQPVQFLNSLEVWGVSPVTKGAGIGTGTTALKGAKEGMTQTVAEIQATIDALMDPGMAGSIIERYLLDTELADLEARLQRAAAHPHPTNLDLVRQDVIKVHGSEHSPAWIETMVAARLDEMIGQYARGHQRGGVQPGIIEAEARQVIGQWARNPAAI